MLCPKAGCKTEIGDDFLAKYVDQATFDKYLQFKQNNEIMVSKDKKYCPNPKCENVVIEANNDAKKVKCPQCTEPMCFQCGIPWHSGQSC